LWLDKEKLMFIISLVLFMGANNQSRLVNIF
jgi:hypothetical protein